MCSLRNLPLYLEHPNKKMFCSARRTVYKISLRKVVRLYYLFSVAPKCSDHWQHSGYRPQNTLMKFIYFQIERQWSFPDTLLLSWGPPVIQKSLLKRKRQTSTLPHTRQLFLVVHIKLHETPLAVATVYWNKPSQYKTQRVHSNSLPKHCRTYRQLKVPSMPLWIAQDSTHSPSWLLLKKTCQTSLYRLSITILHCFWV